MVQHKLVIAGATGVIGRRLVERMAREGPVIGLARRPLRSGPAGVQYHAIDLTDAAVCRADLSMVAGVTHTLYAARHDHDSRGGERVDENTAMLSNLVEAVEAGGQALQHVHVVWGTNFYCSNLGLFKTLASVNDSRILAGNFKA